MKRNCIKKYIIGFLVCILLLGNMSVMPAEAGSSNLIVDSSSFEKELDTMLWNATDSRVSAENGKLVFSAESKKSTALITKTIAANTGYHDELVSFEAAMNLNEIPAGGTFVAALGLGSIEAVMGEAGNIEIRFTNEGGVKMSVMVYDLDGKKTEMVVARPVGSLSNVKIKATISSEAIFTLSLNGSQVCNEKLPITGEGRVGFLQTGSCAVTISDLKVVAHRYDRPENLNIYEDFEEESINVNELTARSVDVTGHYVPYGMEIKEVDGNRVMEFKNLSAGYLGSLHQYSNFELTFDVINLQRVPEMDLEGNVLVPKNESIAVSFGDEAEDYNDWGYETSPDAVVFDSASVVYSMNLGYKQDAKAKGYGYASADCNKDYTIQVSVIDGIVTVSMKWIDEQNFTEILKYKVSDVTPLGYVHIWAAGVYTNFSIDNVSLVNKDIDPNTLEVDFKSAVYDVPEDFKYEKIGYVYRDNAKEDESGNFSPYLFIPIVAVVCAAAFGTVCLVTKKKARKEEHTDVQV